MASIDNGGTNIVLKRMLHHLSDHVDGYQQYFQTETSDGHELSRAYIMGLIKTEAGKRNLERLNEEIDLSGDSYQRLQQFITDAPWSAGNLIRAVAQNTSDLYANHADYRKRDIGYIVDETAHLKKGRYSVGVARQYAGVIGKVENCQVGVYASLVWQSHSTLINERLFLPASWTSDPARCERAGIPVEARTFKTKLELALDMIQSDVAAGLEFDWVGGDGLYGHGLELGNALDDMGLTFLLDLHCDQRIYPLKPTLSVPEKTSRRGPKPTKLQADRDPIKVKWYADYLHPFEWKTITVRDGTKGALTLSVHTAQVWVWDGESDNVIERVLVISRNQADNKIKYSLSNVDYRSTPIERLAYMQAQRYWSSQEMECLASSYGIGDVGVILYGERAYHVQKRLSHAKLPGCSAHDYRTTDQGSGFDREKNSANAI